MSARAQLLENTTAFTNNIHELAPYLSPKDRFLYIHDFVRLQISTLKAEMALDRTQKFARRMNNTIARAQLRRDLHHR